MAEKVTLTMAAVERLKPSKAGRRWVYDAKVAGLAVCITETGAKSFYLYKKIDGKPERHHLGKFPDLTVDAARDKANKLLATIAEGNNPAEAKRKLRGELTLGQLWKLFLEFHAPRKKASSVAEDGRLWSRYLAAWDGRKLSTVTTGDVRKLHATIGEKHGKYAANRALALLSTMFNLAKNHGELKTGNPCEGVKKFTEISRDRFLLLSFGKRSDMSGLLEQSAVFEKSFSQLGAVADSAGGFAGLGTHRSQVFANELGHVGPRQMAPEGFHGIEFWCVRRQVFDRQPVGLTGNPVLNLRPTMGRQPVPQQDHFSSAHMSLQHLEVGQDFWLLHGSRLKSQTQADSLGGGRRDQAGDGRQPFPVERGDEDRRLPARRPGSSHAGSFGKATFIQENQQGFRQSSLFLIRGQRGRTHRLIPSSLRSRALRSGRWQLHPNCPKTFHTCAA